MQQRCFLSLVSLCFLLASLTATAGSPAPKIAEDDWPWWRGPTRNGVAKPGQDLPLKWSAEENVLWKTPVPGRGHGSPTVVGQRIYLATADEKKQIQSVLCFDRDTGKQLWKTDVHQGGFEKKGNKRSSHASCSVACDGERLFVNFNHNKAIHLTALDLDGKILWQKKLTDYVTHQGFGASPAVFGGLVFANADNKGGGAITALDPATGKIVWQHKRPATANYASPVILNVAGKDQLFLTGCELVSSYDPMTGKKLWEIDGATTETVTSTVTDGQVIITSGGYPRNHISAVRADGSGKIQWQQDTRVYVPSMVLHDGYLYSVSDDGVAQCSNIKTGEVTWTKRLGGTFNASLVLVDDIIYGVNEPGENFLYKANPKTYEAVAFNRLGEEVYATPTICGNRMYFRVAEYQGGRRQEMLYCIGKK